MSVSYTNPSLHLVLGDEEFLAERARIEITRTLEEMVGHAEVTRIRAAELSAGTLIQLTSPSLFDDKRIVICEHVEEAGKEAVAALVKQVVDVPPGVAFIVMHSGAARNREAMQKLKKVATVHEVAKLKPQERSRWLMQEFQRHGVRPTPDVVHLVLESVGSDLRELTAAVDQLVADTGGEVSTQAVKLYYAGVAEVSGFDIADLAVAGQARKAVASTRRALQIGIAPNALAGVLSRKMRGIARLYDQRGRVDSNGLARELGMPPFAVQKTVNVARQWNPTAISEAMVLLSDVEAGLRGVGKDPDYVIEDAVRRIAELASR
ncbi:MAG: DNA polymerase III subunit delta [Corynebacterium sp.]|nr:DNA polymerase III subunit delta [Corynebacterium sp.]